MEQRYSTIVRVAEFQVLLYDTDQSTTLTVRARVRARIRTRASKGVTVVMVVVMVVATDRKKHLSGALLSHNPTVHLNSSRRSNCTHCTRFPVLVVTNVYNVNGNQNC
jgi:hypothetical protein